jgi:hypothetical protein
VLTGNTSSDAIAVDLHNAPNTSHEDIYVLGRGNINGDVKFSDGTNRLFVEGNVSSTVGNTTTVTNAFVSGNVDAKTIEAAGSTTTLDIFVSQQQTGGVLNTSRTRTSTLTVGEHGTVQFALTKNTSVSVPMIGAQGNVTFAGNTKVMLAPTTFLPSADLTRSSIQHGLGQSSTISVRRRAHQ